MSELEFTDEEQSYIDLEIGKPSEPEQPSVEEPASETPEPVEEVVEADAEKDGEDSADDTENEKPEKEEPRPPRRTKDETIKSLRADRRELREQTRQQAETQRKLQERLDVIAARLENPPTPPPDPDMDPEGYQRHVEGERDLLREENEKIRQDTAKQTEAQREFDEINDFIITQEDDYVEDHPDYDEAIRWGKEQRAKVYSDQLGLDEKTAMMRVEQEILEAAKQIRNIDGAKIPHYLYQKAVEMGWGNANKPRVEENKKTQTDDLKVISAGQKTAKNPRGGNSGNKGLQLEELVAMDDEDFNKIASDHKVLKKLFGG